nr:ABC transporter ATP-binding protein [Nitrosomonas nitrosa]
MTLLRIENVSKLFGGVRALDTVSFEVEAGAICSVIGPNGAGKSTLFNVITGIFRPSGGSVFLEGRSIIGEPSYRLASRGMSRTFQNLQIFLNMTAVENVQVGRHQHMDGRFLPALLSLPSIRRNDAVSYKEAVALMMRVGLEDYVGAASDAMPYGALKRLEIARALASRPKLLLMDEPAAGLNETESVAMLELIKEIAKSGVTVVLIEHDMRLVMGVSEHIVVLNHGKKLAEGTAAQIQSNPAVIAAYLGEQEAA